MSFCVHAHNIVHTICAQYGDDYSKEVENLWCALCTWRHNIRVTINYLARLVHRVNNVPLVLQQAKRIVVCFSRSQSTCVVNELIKDLNVREPWVKSLDGVCLHMPVDGSVGRQGGEGHIVRS